MADVLIAPRQVEERTSLSRTALDRRVAEGKFPKPIKLDSGKRGGRLFYVEAEIDRWIEQQIALWRDGEGPEVPPPVRHGYADREVVRQAKRSGKPATGAALRNSNEAA